MNAQDEYLLLLDLTYHVAQSLDGMKYPDQRFYDCNRLALKLFYHAATIHWLRQGTRAPVPEPDGASFFDAGSVAVIARTALETYLTMFELFFEQISEDEREFRHACWLLDGLVIRENLVPLTPNLAERMAHLQLEIEQLRTRIKNTKVHQSLSDKQKRKVMSGQGLNRRFEDRIKNAGFAPKTAKRMNRYLSGYVHSDGLSAIQLMDSKSQINQQDHIDTLMYVVMMAMSKTILEYKRLFPPAASACAARPKSLEVAIMWSGVAGLMDNLQST